MVNKLSNSSILLVWTGHIMYNQTNAKVLSALHLIKRRKFILRLTSVTDIYQEVLHSPLIYIIASFINESVLDSLRA